MANDTKSLETTAVARPRRAWPAFRIRGPWKRMAAAAGVIALAAIGAWLYHLNAGLAAAKRFASDRQWDEAVDAASRYLRLWPGEGEATLLRAEARLHAADAARIDPILVVPQVIAELAEVDDDSPHASSARLHAARLTLLILTKPAAAERLALQAIQLDPNSVEAHLLCWRILDLTRRSDLAEPVFREVLRCSPPQTHAGYLRDWYLSQFAPATANRNMDRLLGVLANDEQPTFDSEHRRYERFRRAEPAEPMHVAAIAMMYIHRQEVPRASRILDDAAPTLVGESAELLNAHAEVAYAEGRIDRLRDVLSRWPSSAHDFRYWKWYGIVAEELDSDIVTACDAYEKSLADWPGSLDWQLVHRRGNCLQRLGRHDDAAAAHARSVELEALISPELHGSIRQALVNLGDPGSLEIVARFYDQIGRRDEAALWTREINRLRPLRLSEPINDRQNITQGGGF